MAKQPEEAILPPALRVNAVAPLMVAQAYLDLLCAGTNAKIASIAYGGMPARERQWMTNTLLNSPTPIMPAASPP